MCIVGNGDCYFDISTAKWSRAKSQYQTNKKTIFNLLVNRKKDVLRNLEKKRANGKGRKKIAEASDFGDKLIRLDMIVSYKPNISVPVD